MAVIMSVLLSLFIGFSLSSNQTQAAKKDSGTLKIGMEANYPPYNWISPPKLMELFQLMVLTPMLMVMMFKLPRSSVNDYTKK